MGFHEGTVWIQSCHSDVSQLGCGWIAASDRAKNTYLLTVEKLYKRSQSDMIIFFYVFWKVSGIANVFCCVSTHRFWRGTYVIGHHWGEEGASSLGPQKYPTAPCRALRAPWLSSGSPPNSLWGHQDGSTSNLSAGSGENNRGGYDKVEGDNGRGGE